MNYSDYRPFKDEKECWYEMQRHQPVGWVIDETRDTIDNIVSLSDGFVYIKDDYFDMNEMYERYLFGDGEIFGAKI